MKKIIFLLIVSMCCSCSKILIKQNENIMSKINLVPKPLLIEEKDGDFYLSSETRLIIKSSLPEAAEVGNYLADKIQTSTGIVLKTGNAVNDSDQEKVITLYSEVNDETVGDEGYILDVHPTQITIRARHPAGLFYGVQTLLQLFPPEIYISERVKSPITWKAPAVHIVDKPRFSWRGMHLDVCRHFFPKEFVKKYIDYLAYHKMNTFHWHLTDDQGWRIEIKKYPKLTEIGAWRADRPGISWNKCEPQQPNEEATYGGFYSQDDVKEIIEYARLRFVTIVPEIEMPGHAIAALAAYPQYSCTGGPFTVATGSVDWTNANIFCAGNDSTFAFLENILSEVIDLFPGKYIHIGGDEAGKAKWKNCPKCRQRIADEDLKDEHELQSYFINRIGNFVASKGKQIIGWDEILEGGLATGATVMSWRSVAGGIHAAQLGQYAVMTPKTHCYFDYYQRDAQLEPEAIGGFLPLEKVIEFEAVPNELNAEQAKFILGGQGNLWSEYIATPEHAEYMALPRMCALAEAVWTTKEQRNPNDFMNRIMFHYLRLDALNINYCEPPLSGFDTQNAFINEASVEIRNPRPYGVIHYTLDGSDPNELSPVYTHPIKLTNTTTMKTALISPSGKRSNIQTAFFEKQVPRKSAQQVELKPGLKFKYYDLESRIQSTADLEKYSISQTGTISQFIFPPINKLINFGVVYSGYIEIRSTGVYKFTTTSDDGSRLFIGDKLIVDNDGDHGDTDRHGEIALEKGWHPIRVEFFQAGGGKTLVVSYEGPGIPKSEIPADVLSQTSN
ncbi:family 20 glycosylhydrolase [candidate division KSB1 bacterium]|nr:family 20 glycosylhydrolase [candidate division KSB1 bacterium]